MSSHATTDVETVPPHEHAASGARIASMEEYRAMYDESVRDPGAFWAKMGRQHLTWHKDFDAAYTGSFAEGDVAWFLGGRLNACHNCVDRHIPELGDKPAIIWESDEPDHSRTYTYREVLREVCRIANVLRRNGVRCGDNVAIYMPMVPELAFTMLACARIGAPHSIVFAGFSAEALRQRIQDAECQWVVTTDQGMRGGRTLELKQIVDKAVSLCGDGLVQKVFMFRRTHAEVPVVEGRDVDMEEAVKAERPYCPIASMDSEDILFLLYTSGSTGKPKGLAHTTAGYLLYTKLTHQYVFDYRPGDVYACVADCGWITGHSYIVYGPMLNGATTLMFESTPLYPDHGRYWDLVQKHRVTQLYTAPTAIRALMRYGTEVFDKYDLSSLRVLGTVGEPINPEAWRWYHDNVGKGRCAVVDTYWQTETGGIMITSLPGATPMKPGAAGFPFFGIQPTLLDRDGNELTASPAEGFLCMKHLWPGMARTVWGNHERYLAVYMRPYHAHYFTGDGAKRDKDGFLWITGRVDDVLNVSGHRLGTAEVESALVAHADVAEAAVTGYPHEVKGQAVCCYVTLRQGVEETDELLRALKQCVRDDIGAIATPDLIVITPGLPKTRSGKIMRRVLRKIVAGESDQLGDTTTLADPSVVEYLVRRVGELTGSAGK